MLRKILAVLVGLAAGVLVIGGMEMLGHQIFPLPEGLDMNLPENRQIYMNTAPLGALLFIPLAWAFGSFAAGLVSTLIGKDNRSRNALLCGCILLGFGIINLASFEHPFWFWPLSAFVFIPTAWLGYRVVKKSA